MNVVITELLAFMENVHLLVAQAAAVFATEGGPLAAPNPVDVKALHAKIGQQALEIDFLAGALGRSPGSSAKR